MVYIYDIASDAFHSAEALVRLNDPDLGFISPEKLIPIAEANTSILKVGELVLRHVCEFLKENDIHALGLEFIEINLSSVQLKVPKT